MNTKKLIKSISNQVKDEELYLVGQVCTYLGVLDMKMSIYFVWGFKYNGISCKEISKRTGEYMLYDDNGKSYPIQLEEVIDIIMKELEEHNEIEY